MTEFAFIHPHNFRRELSYHIHKIDLRIHHFVNVFIGVRRFIQSAADQRNVVLFVFSTNAPYVLTKLLQASQQVMSEDKNGLVISLKAVWNFELEREILGFGESLTVLSPLRLRRKIAGRIARMGRAYEQAESAPGEPREK